MSCKRISKAFECNDLERSEEWSPGNCTRLAMLDCIGRRRMFYAIDFIKINVKPDKKTRQWWAKVSVDPSFFNFHMYAHHLMRQVLDVANDGVLKHRDEKNVDVDVELLKKWQSATEQCVWRPNG